MQQIFKFIQKVSQNIYSIYVLLVFVVSFFIQLPFFFLFSLFPKKIRYVLIFGIYKVWVHIFFFLIGITLRLVGREKINKDMKCVVVANHQSFLDTPMIFAALPFFVKPLARSDYGKIPLFGYIYKVSTISVDRDSMASKKESFQKMISTIEEDDTNIFIFPEGSFNQTDMTLKPFYDGAFRIAKETHRPIVPIIFPDTIKRWHYSSFWSWRPGICRAYILDPITVDQIDSMTVNELKEYVHQEMEIQMVNIDT